MQRREFNPEIFTCDLNYEIIDFWKVPESPCWK